MWSSSHNGTLNLPGSTSSSSRKHMYKRTLSSLHVSTDSTCSRQLVPPPIISYVKQPVAEVHNDKTPTIISHVRKPVDEVKNAKTPSFCRVKQLDAEAPNDKTPSLMSRVGQPVAKVQNDKTPSFCRVKQLDAEAPNDKTPSLMSRVGQPVARVPNDKTPTLISRVGMSNYITPYPSLKTPSSNLSYFDVPMKDGNTAPNEASENFHINGLYSELVFEYAEQTEAWQWFHNSLNVKSQQSEEENIPHECYAFFAEKDLEQIMEKLKNNRLSEQEIDHIIRQLLLYIGESYDMRTRTLSHLSTSRFKHVMRSDNWVMVSLIPQALSNHSKARDMEYVFLMIARHLGIYNKRESDQYGLYNNDPGRPTTFFYSNVFNDEGHEHRQKLLCVLKDSIVWGIKYGKKLYISKLLKRLPAAKAEYRKEDQAANHQKIIVYHEQRETQNPEYKLEQAGIWHKERAPQIRVRSRPRPYRKRRLCYQKRPDMRTWRKNISRAHNFGQLGHRQTKSRICPVLSSKNSRYDSEPGACGGVGHHQTTSHACPSKI